MEENRMPKLILRCNYLKNAPPSHLENFVTYIGTRDGVEKVESTAAHCKTGGSDTGHPLQNPRCGPDA